MTGSFLSFDAARLAIGRGAGALVAAAVCVASGLGAAKAAPDPALGERLYEDGILASGEPLVATTKGDLTFSGAQMSCANCHRRSGYGSSEGGIYVLPVTGPTLYRPRELDRADLFKKLFKEYQPKKFWTRIRSPRMRPAYTNATLARAIRDGVDPTGRALDPLMPRYRMSDADMANLTAYLKTLSVASDPGVDDRTIHFATVVTENADLGERAAMLATLRTFVAWMNKDTMGDTSRPNFSPNYRSQFIKAYRLWDLAVWELSGPPETWGEQLAAKYRERPVFAVIGGLVDGPWAPVQRFCEREAVPCLFANTELPVIAEESTYSVHFTRGLSLEAEVIGRHLIDAGGAGGPTRVVQLHDARPAGAVPAAALGAALDGDSRFRVEHRQMADAMMFRATLDKLAGGASPDDVWVLWPGHRSRTVMDWMAANPTAGPRRIFLPSKALAAAPDPLPAGLRGRLYFSYPYDLPGGYRPHAFRVRAWMRSMRLPITHPRLQFNTYYALNMVQFGLVHIVDNFSRDYLLEYVEHEAENALNPGVYPRLSLGPDQRFASKGAYLVRLNGDRQVEPVSKWIVP